MVNAVILFDVERTHIKKVAEALAALPEVTEVYSVAGEYDLVAIIRVQESEALADLVTDRLAKLQGILETETLIAFRTWSRRDLESGFSLGGEK